MDIGLENLYVDIGTEKAYWRNDAKTLYPVPASDSREHKSLPYFRPKWLRPILNIRSRKLHPIRAVLYQCSLHVYSYFEKGCRKKCARNNPKR